MTLGYSRNDVVLGFQSYSLGLGLGFKATAIRRGSKLYECLLVMRVQHHKITVQYLRRCRAHTKPKPWWRHWR